MDARITFCFLLFPLWPPTSPQSSLSFYPFVPSSSPPRGPCKHTGKQILTRRYTKVILCISQQHHSNVWPSVKNSETDRSPSPINHVQKCPALTRPATERIFQKPSRGRTPWSLGQLENLFPNCHAMHGGSFPNGPSGPLIWKSPILVQHGTPTPS